jgi:hypothetical protein
MEGYPILAAARRGRQWSRRVPYLAACCCPLQSDKTKAAAQPHHVVVSVVTGGVGDMSAPMIAGDKHQPSLRGGTLTFKAFPQRGETFQDLKNFTQDRVKRWCHVNISLKDCRFEDARGAHLKADEVIFDRVYHSDVVYLVPVDPDVVAQPAQAVFNMAP